MNLLEAYKSDKPFTRPKFAHHTGFVRIENALHDRYVFFLSNEDRDGPMFLLDLESLLAEDWEIVENKENTFDPGYISWLDWMFENSYNKLPK